MWHWFLALRWKSGTEQAMELLHQHKHLKVSLCTQACICQTSAQPLCRILHGIFLHWARETKRVGWEYQSLLIYLVSCGPEFVYWAWKCKAVKAFPCKWNTKSKSPFFLVCSTSKVSPWKKSYLLSGSAVVMAAAALFMSGFPSAMPRMGEVLGLSLMLCERKCHALHLLGKLETWR